MHCCRLFSSLLYRVKLACCEANEDFLFQMCNKTIYRCHHLTFINHMKSELSQEGHHEHCSSGVSEMVRLTLSNPKPKWGKPKLRPFSTIFLTKSGRIKPENKTEINNVIIYKALTMPVFSGCISKASPGVVRQHNSLS